MTTLLQRARWAIVDALNQSGKGPGIPEFTTRRWLPSEILRQGEIRGAVLFHREAPSLAQGIGGAITRRTHNLAVQVVTAVANPDEIDDALEPARTWMVQQLGDTTLGGLVHSLEEGETVWETAQLERIHGAFVTLWRLNFQTLRSDLTRPS